MTPLETLALIAVIAVLLVGLARTTLRRRERRRTPRDLDPDYTPLQLYRTGVSRPAGVPPLRRAEPPATPVPTPVQPASGPPAAAAPVPVQPVVVAPAGPAPAPQPVAPSPAEPVRAVAEPVAPAPRRVEARPRPEAPPPRKATPRAPARPAERAPADTASAPSMDGTLQLLPGRLEVLSGLGHREEIRFVKVGGREPAVTFGRSQGEPHLHVRLESPTVSRLHARMRRTDAGWMLSNLSATNPVVVNGEPITNGSERRLADGDRIEMGEVVFQFRAG